MAHTPGPWAIIDGHIKHLEPVRVPAGRDKRGNRLYKQEMQPQGIPVARIMFADHPNGKANATLIVAAPAMLAALVAQTQADEASAFAGVCAQDAKSNPSRNLRERALEAANEADRLASIAFDLRHAAIAQATNA